MAKRKRKRKTPKIGHPPIPMRKVGPDLTDDDKDEGRHGSFYDGFERLERRGDWFWNLRKGKRTLILAIPCVDRPGNRGWQWSMWSIGYKNASDAQWSWNGNDEQPTLKPSLHAKGIWHGFVRDGTLVEA